MENKIQQAPIRNATKISASVYSHSGEFAPVYTDLELIGRGLDFKFIRHYRSSLSNQIGELGRGWSSNVCKKIEREHENIIFHDGTGEAFIFAGENRGRYTTPAGLYGTLLEDDKQLVLYQRHGLIYRFTVPELGGRLMMIEDRNQNSIQLSYIKDRIVIADTLNRKINLLVSDGFIQEMTDHARRTWKYVYDQNNCLIEVKQPGRADFPNGTSIRYAYDSDYRLISITDPKGQMYLINHFDTSGRIVTQEHGSGVFKINYDITTGARNGFPIYRTTYIRKNGGKIVFEHNTLGNVISKTIFAGKASFAPEDIPGSRGKNVPMITSSVYNRNSELVSRTYPTGERTEWAYTEDEKNPLNQGNLLKIKKIPQADVKSDQTSIVTQYEFEPKYQLTTKKIDPRGNQTSYDYDQQGNLILTTYPAVTIQPVNSIPRPRTIVIIQTNEFQYNSNGQLIQRRHLDGSITQYYYYPLNDPIGRRGTDTASNATDKPVGYLAREVRDANGKALKTEYAYDKYGNLTTVWDCKGNPVRMQYNSMNLLDRVIGREPFKYRIDYKYDANNNEIESVQSFERLEYDEKNHKTIIRSSALHELKVYNSLDNLTLRKIVGGDKVITEHFTRDANENIIRQVQPSGNTTEYKYDERDLLIEKQLGTGTPDMFSELFTYTLNNAVRTQTDGKGKITMHHYDGFQRNKGHTNSMGIRKTQWFDEADNVVRVEINGQEDRGSVPLMATKYNFDQWNRVYRVDRDWYNPAGGQDLGQSKWDGKKGIVSTVLEYAQNGLLGKIWTESDNVSAVEYDGAGRITKLTDMTGEEFSFEYDENNNPTLMKYLGPEVQGRRCERALRRSYDEMDRLVWQQENGEAPEKFEYNALGQVINYVGRSGIEIRHLDDALGRNVGHAFTITDASNTAKAQRLVRRFEYDDNYRLTAYTDASGNRTAYCYDTHDRQTKVISPTGNVATVEYDANGNIVREVDENNNEINNRYDALNRLVGRQSLIKSTGKETVEQLEYDGLNRLIAAITPDAVNRRTYDSLSRVLTEHQGDYALRYTYDSIGNPVGLIYPSGEEVFKAYDIRNRVTSVKNKAAETLASFNYRANDQIAEIWLGNAIKAGFTYNQQEHLESVEYRRTDNRELVDGFRYQYDDTGKITHEIQLSEGPAYGERYYYDNACRPTRAQYGVEDVSDPNSTFEHETSFKHFPEGSWQRRVDVDSHGEVLDDQSGTINQDNSYQSFGGLSFAYDANGNCLRRGKSNPGYWDYTYDQDNKLIKAEWYDAQGNIIQTIDYFYDAFGRQVRKVVTDDRGNVTEYMYVWAGDILMEEYENGILVRTYLYGLGKQPVQLTVNKGGRANYFYTHNGKGLASGLVHQRDPYDFAEKYGYEVTGASYMQEINGVKVGLPSRKTTNSSLANSILSGSYLRDWVNGSHSSIGGIHTNPEIAAVLNSVGKGHGSVKGVLDNQTKGYLNMIGNGMHGSGPTAKGAKGGLPPGVQLGFRAPNWSLISEEGFNTSSNSMVLGPFHFEQHEKTSPDGGIVGGGRTIGVGIRGIGLENSWSIDNTGTYLAEKEAAEKKEAYYKEAFARASAIGTAEAKKKAEEEKKKKAEEDTKKNADEEAKKKAEEEKKKKEEEEKKKKKGGGMVDPDSGFGAGSFMFPSPQQVEAKLMQNKRPLNPNSGLGGPGILVSEGPIISKWDPVALYDVEFSLMEGSPRGIVPGGGYTDPVRGWEPFAPSVDPTKGGGINPVAQPWP